MGSTSFAGPKESSNLASPASLTSLTYLTFLTYYLIVPNSYSRMD